MTPETRAIELDVLALTNGPDAIARHDGQAIFVAGAAPGDRIRARIVEDRGSFARAEVVERLATGAEYRVPPCPWVASCGGCPWQHVTYAAQLAAKAANVHEALARIAGVQARRELPIIASPDEWRYRHRIRLHVDHDRRVGYVRPRSQEVVEIDACVVAEPAISAVLPALRALVRGLATTVDSVELTTNGRGGIVVHMSASGAFRPADATSITTLLAGGGSVAGVRIVGRGWHHEWGDASITTAEHGASPQLVQRAGTFSQVNAAANRLLVEVVRQLATPARKVLDLFCGAGNLSLPLAATGAAVVGIDRERAAIEAAVASAAASRLTAARFETASAEHFLRQQGYTGADLVLLDPPRGGAGKVAQQLARLRPPRILYVSCDPATLARDVRTLATAQYVVDRVQPLDLFPQTEHVETVLEAVRTAP